MKCITSEQAPKAVGPYSHAVHSKGLLFCSGQIPLDPESSELVAGGIEAQTKQVLFNISQVLSSQHLSLQDVVKTTIFLTDLNDFSVVNALYAKAFGDHKPARSTIQVAALPMGCAIEIEVIAETIS